MSVNVPSGVKHSTQLLTSTFSATSYALRMICSLFMAMPFLFELRAQERGDQVVRRSRGLEEADAARKDVQHVLPYVHLDTLMGSEPKRVVEEDLRSPHVHLDGRRLLSRPIERGHVRVPTIAAPEILADARFETRSRQHRIIGGLALDARPSKRKIRPRGQQDTAAGARLFLEQRQREAPARGIAHERHVLRAKLRREAAIRRSGIVERGRKLVLRREAVVGNEGGHARSHGDLPEQMPEGAGTPVDEAATM